VTIHRTAGTLCELAHNAAIQPGSSRTNQIALHHHPAPKVPRASSTGSSTAIQHRKFHRGFPPQNCGTFFLTLTRSLVGRVFHAPDHRHIFHAYLLVHRVVAHQAPLRHRRTASRTSSLGASFRGSAGCTAGSWDVPPSTHVAEFAVLDVKRGPLRGPRRRLACETLPARTRRWALP
jgi:hypothetical protein